MIKGNQELIPGSRGIDLASPPRKSHASQSFSTILCFVSEMLQKNSLLIIAVDLSANHSISCSFLSNLLRSYSPLACVSPTSYCTFTLFHEQILTQAEMIGSIKRRRLACNRDFCLLRPNRVHHMLFAMLLRSLAQCPV